jgi:hypothetical protein
MFSATELYLLLTHILQSLLNLEGIWAFFREFTQTFGINCDFLGYKALLSHLQFIQYCRQLRLYSVIW